MQSISPDQNFTTRFLAAEELSFPTEEAELICIVEPNANSEENPSLDEVTVQRRAEINSLIEKHGAVLFRGWENSGENAEKIDVVEHIDSFEKCLEGLGIKLSNEYRPGVAPRVQRGKWAFTSTEAPPFLSILPHTEMTYSNLRPEKIAFFCAEAPLNHGETPLFNCRGIWTTLANMSEEGNEVAKSLMLKLKNGVCEFQRKFPGEATDWDKNASKAVADANQDTKKVDIGIGTTKGGAQWQRSFDSNDPAFVEKFCQEAGMKLEWEELVESGKGAVKSLQTSSFVPSIVRHHKTGEPCVQLQTPLMGKVAYDVMVELFPDRFGIDVNPQYHQHVNDAKVVPPFKRLKFHDTVTDTCSFLTEEETRLFYTMVWKHAVTFKWQSGDILVVDNISTAHARMNVDTVNGGPRKLFACLGDVYDVRNIERFTTMPSKEAVDEIVKNQMRDSKPSETGITHGSKVSRE